VRTTISLEDDAVEAIQAFARSRRLSLGKAASELIRRGSLFQLGTKRKNGLPVLDASDDFPVITTEHVHELLEEE